MSEKQNLYFIAIVPPQSICEEITHFKDDFANRFESKAALKVMPHITLKAPFRFPASVHEQLVKQFKQMHITVSSFQQELNDFEAFHNKRQPVIYVKPVENLSLSDLQRQVLQSFSVAFPAIAVRGIELEFKPHITVAYRDLQPAMFKKAWHEYRTKNYAATFDVNGFQLLQHNGKMWNIINTFLLPPSSA